MADGGAGGSANFTLALLNKVSKPAADAKKAIGGVKDSLYKLDKASIRAERDAEKHLKAQLAAANKLAREQDRIFMSGKRRESQETARKKRVADQQAKNDQRALMTKSRGELAHQKQMIAAAKGREAAAARSVREHSVRFKQQQALVAKGNREKQFAADVKSAGSGGFSAGGAASGMAVGATAAVGVAALAAAAGVAYLGAKFVGATYDAVAFGQASVKSLTLLTGDAQKGAEAFDATRAMAQRLGLDVDHTIHSFSKLLAMQFEIGKANELIAMGSDLKAVLNLTDDQVGGILLAISQIKSKGKLQAEEMLQLAERGVSQELVYEALGQTLGKTTDQLRKLQEQGKVKAPEAIEAILGAVRKKTGTSHAGEAGEAFAKSTLTGMSAKFAAGTRNLFIDLGQRIEPALMPIANKIFDFFAKMSESDKFTALLDLLVTKFEYFGLWFEANWPTIESGLVGGFDLIDTTIRRSFDALDLLATHWDLVKGTLIGVSIVVGLLSIGVLMLVALAWVAVAVIIAIPAAIGYAIYWLVGAIPAAFEAAWNWVGALKDGAIAGFAAFTQLVVDAAGSMADAVINRVQSIFKIASPSQIFEEMGGNVAMGLAIGIEGDAPVAEGASANMAVGAIQGAGGAMSSVRGGGGGIGDITIQVVAPEGTSDPEAYGRAVGRGARSEFLAMLEGLELEAAA